MDLDIHAAALGDWVPDFVRVSNRIAGITRDPTAAEIGAHRGLLAANSLRVENLELFVHHIEPGAALRDSSQTEAEPGDMGSASTVDLRADLATIVRAARTRSASPYRLHRIYGLLRPFTDGNARCGRAFWMWQMMRGTQEELAEFVRLSLFDTKHPWGSESLLRSTMT
jgi:hypothetical protein